MWDEDLLANCIGKVTIENSVAKEGVKIKQAFSITATDKGAQCYQITNNWDYYDSITIPDSISIDHYGFFVYVE